MEINVSPPAIGLVLYSKFAYGSQLLGGTTVCIPVTRFTSYKNSPKTRIQTGLFKHSVDLFPFMFGPNLKLFFLSLCTFEETNNGLV